MFLHYLQCGFTLSWKTIKIFSFSNLGNLISLGQNVLQLLQFPNIGTNELFSINTRQYERYLRDTIHELRICNPECIIILSSILPRPRDFLNSETHVVNFNNVLKQLASSLNNVKYMACENFFFIVEWRMPINNLFWVDKLHLSTTWLNRIFNFIACLWENHAKQSGSKVGQSFSKFVGR